MWRQKGDLFGARGKEGIATSKRVWVSVVRGFWG